MKTFITFIIIATLFLTSCNSSDEESSPDTSSAANSDTPLGLDPDSEAIPLDNQSCDSAFIAALGIDPISGLFIDDSGTSVAIIPFTTLLLGNDVIGNQNNNFNLDNVNPDLTYSFVTEIRNAETNAVLGWCQQTFSGAELLGTGSQTPGGTPLGLDPNLEVSISAADEFGCSSALDRVLNLEFSFDLDTDIFMEFIDMNNNEVFDSGIDVEVTFFYTILRGNDIIIENNSDYELASIDRNETYNLVTEIRNANGDAVLGWCQESISGAELLGTGSQTPGGTPLGLDPDLEIFLSAADEFGCFDALDRELNIEYNFDSGISIQFIDMNNNEVFDSSRDTEINSPSFILLGTTVILDFDSIDRNVIYTQVNEVRNADTDSTLGWCQEEVSGAVLLGLEGPGSGSGPGDGMGNGDGSGPGDTSSDVPGDASGEDYGEDYDDAPGDTPDGDTPDEDTSSEY